MNTPISRIGCKSQTVIPKSVREVLGLKPGDSLRYRIERGRVIIERARREQEEGPFAVFTEWTDEADEKAFGSL